MYKTHYIQRCMFRNEKTNKSEVTGFDSVFSCDYMGSAEFEFGALPESLKTVTPILSAYEIVQAKEFKAKTGEGIFLLAIPDRVPGILKVLREAAKYPSHNRKEIHFKENPRLKASLEEDPGYYRSRVVLWWDITEHWFACLGKPTAELLFLGLQKVRDRYKAEGKI